MLERNVSPTRRALEPFDSAQRSILTLTAAVSVFLFILISNVLGWPVFLRLEASLLASASPVSGIATVMFGLIATFALGCLLLGRLRYEAGLFTACIGLAGLAARAGTVGATLRGIATPRLYLAMTMETIVFLGLMLLAWLALGKLAAMNWVFPEPPLNENEVASTFSLRIMATLTQGITTGLIVLLLSRVDNKKQVLISIAVASLIGSMISHQSIPIRPSVVFWTGPFLTAIAGYIWALRSPGQWAIGMPANPLAMAAPIDYASVGTAGAIMGYWMSRQWKDSALQAPLPPDALD